MHVKSRASCMLEELYKRRGVALDPAVCGVLWKVRLLLLRAELLKQMWAVDQVFPLWQNLATTQQLVRGDSSSSRGFDKVEWDSCRLGHPSESCIV